MLILIENDFSIVPDSNEKSVSRFIRGILGDLSRSVVVHLHVRIQCQKLRHIICLTVKMRIRIKRNVCLIVVGFYSDA